MHKTGSTDAPEAFFEKRRCWTLAYESAGFHLDVLPAIPDADFTRSPNAVLLTDTKLRPWQHANPKDYAVWFRTRSEEMRRKIEAKARAANVADVPNWVVRSTLQRLVQVLKWHCYSAFAEDIDNRPPSILITTLAGHAYHGQDDLGTALLEVAQRMPLHIDRNDGKWEVLNPAHRKENFTDKWNEPDTAHRRGVFLQWLGDIQRDIETAYDTQNAGIDVLVDRLSGAFDPRADRVGQQLGPRHRRPARAQEADRHARDRCTRTRDRSNLPPAHILRPPCNRVEVISTSPGKRLLCARPAPTRRSPSAHTTP